MWGMSLKIYLLGQFKLQANDLPIELPSRPAQSLLAYLVLNSGVSHRREKLATLLWPESTESNARSYLRQALWRLRKCLESGSISWEDHLQISDISVTFDSQSNYWLDADRILEAGEARPVDEIIESVSPYQGELLPGFYDEWIVLERNRIQTAYHQKMNQLLGCLIQSGQLDEALIWGEQWIRLGYSPEPAFRALMRAYAGLGDQSMVSATYQRCMDSLDRELGLEPSLETQQLYEQILRGELEQYVAPRIQISDIEERQPAFLDQGCEQTIEKPIFVARERELAKLESYLELVLANNGRVVFITGEAGSGKTALLQEITHHIQEAREDIIIVCGNCNAHTGIGDPYLPFREILAMLTGDVEARYVAGAISSEHALRLWHTFPLSVQALVEAGPELIDTFVSGSSLLDRAAVCDSMPAKYLIRLRKLVEGEDTGMIIPSPQQSDLFEQYTRLLQALSQKISLVLVVDDLQWADLGSISLLFHLGRHLAGSRILIAGAYRPEEVALGRDGARHPLEAVINELQREYGDITVNVDQAKRRAFMEALLDNEPNRLEHPFRVMLYQLTQGHPLFTIELLRGMQERGDLVLDQDGMWIEGAALDWETLPARVEAVVAERINRLAQPLQDALHAASVEGEIFTAEVVAQVLEIDERKSLGHFSRELDRKHRLVRAQSIQRLDGNPISRYRFRHIITQKYLYNSLDPVERVHLHEQVGNALEEIYSAQGDEGTIAIAPQLARHFQEARIEQKAIHYLHQAGRRAVDLSAIQEATAHLNMALALLMDLPYSPEREQQELALQLTLGMASLITSSPSSETKNAYTRARQLCQQTGETTQLCQILIGLAVFYYVRAEHQRALELAVDALSIAEQANDKLLVWLGHWCLGVNLFALGEYVKAKNHISLITSSYEPQQHHIPLVNLHFSDPGLGALAYESCYLWCLGYPDQAMKSNQAALALAREFDHPFSLADVLCHAGCMFNAMYRDVEALSDNADEMMQLSTILKYRGWLARSTCYRGSAQVKLGQVKEGIANIKAGIADNLESDNRLLVSIHLSILAEAYAQSGQPREGLKTLEDAFYSIEQTNEHHWEAEVYRIQGELLLMQGDEAKAEASFLKAIGIARSQSAKSWELRATTSLARLWQEQGQLEDARQVLGDIYSWFTEGFDSPDLRETKMLLRAMA
jgi:DNA-binding SARP family transcriptional activator/predicted ATPase